MSPTLLSIFEWTAVVLGLAYVFLLAREKAWAWPAGILGSALSMAVLLDAKLYNDVWLYGLYVVLGFYGWYLWTWGKSEQQARPVVQTPLKEALTLGLAGLLGTMVLGYLFSRYTDADIPYVDAFTSSFSVVGTYMQARKHLQNWLLWQVVNTVYIGVYAYKGLYAFAGLSAIYLVLAVDGYRRWKTALASQHQEASVTEA